MERDLSHLRRGGSCTGKRFRNGRPHELAGGARNTPEIRFNPPASECPGRNEGKNSLGRVNCRESRRNKSKRAFNARLALR